MSKGTNGDVYIGDTAHPSVIPMLFSCCELDLAFVIDKKHLNGGKFLWLVGVTEKIGKSLRDKYEHVLVIHASALPKGRGWSPWIHELREGADEICISVIEAAEKIDAGDVWIQSYMTVPKTMLYDDIINAMYAFAHDMMSYCIAHADDITPTPQQGEPTHYKRLTDEDSRIPMDEATFDRLRTCDPLRYPPFFEIRGKRYEVFVREACE